MRVIHLLPILLIAIVLRSAPVVGDEYPDECIENTQPPFFVKVWLFFKNGFVYTPPEAFTKQSLCGYTRCCPDDGAEGLPGSCKCPLAQSDSDKHEKFVKGMFGESESDPGWCGTVGYVCDGYIREACDE
mmetsp:Transcript_45224/g.54838  ORF Transcript_45224/g.54838 Transcript_45224/m.54838 type:complete len:130 (+) Transcript_45224:279-668(+)|eukprot:CAMPEP_0172478840 /NCGR_PEP_ID=MMETSP1066-20121228/3062_1 /TAXON_ID=671091 /ORGANISM="Coscinodiscus wailesii, Strain CCMP2513" /LENGTH=129 /DNA_ID=CAMNT_0013238743 /DNA_START=247 /DNA_END=636 /DNA_ORIENTATION=-